jgi:hypothetical protein
MMFAVLFHRRVRILVKLTSWSFGQPLARCESVRTPRAGAVMSSSIFRAQCYM